MFKTSSRVGIIGSGILGVVLIVSNLSGCGQDRPGVRYDKDSPISPDNVDWNDPAKYQDKLNHLMFLVKGENTNKASRSAKTLGGMKAQAEPVLEDLKALKDHPNDEVREAIQGAIKQIEEAIQKRDAGTAE